MKGASTVLRVIAILWNTMPWPDAYCRHNQLTNLAVCFVHRGASMETLGGGQGTGKAVEVYNGRV